MSPSWRLLSLAVVFFQLVALTFGVDSSSISASAQAKSTTLLKSTTVKASSSTTSTASKTSSAAAQTHTIQVGNGDHKFKPDVVQAGVGDTIEFDFYPANHSVVRAEYTFPCIPYEKTGSGKQGFFSDFHPVDAVLDKPPRYTVKINDTAPIFFYCSAPGSCITYGMVGVINPNASTSLETQRQLAQSASYMLQPGEDFPAEAPLPSGLPSPAPPNPTSPTLPPSAGSIHAPHLSTGAIAGIAIACISVVVLGSLLFFFFGRFRGLKEEIHRKNSTITRNMSPRSPFFHSPNNPQPQVQAQTPHSSPSPAYTQPPMSAHAAPAAASIPPAYMTASPAYSPVAEAPTVNRRSAAYSQTFAASPSYFVDGPAVTYKAPYSADMTSPVDPKLIPLGAYGRQLHELQRLAASPPPEPFAPPYARLARGDAPPVEIEDTSASVVRYI